MRINILAVELGMTFSDIFNTCTKHLLFAKIEDGRGSLGWMSKLCFVLLCVC